MLSEGSSDGEPDEAEGASAASAAGAASDDDDDDGADDDGAAEDDAAEDDAGWSAASAVSATSAARAASVRFDPTVVRTSQCAASGATLVSAADVIRAVVGCSRDYAGQMIRRLQGRVELETHMVTPACGGRPVVFCDACSAAKLLMACPGKAARDVRVRYAEALLRHMRADPSVLTDIVHHNAGVPESVLHFLGYTPNGPAAIAQISDFAVETVLRFRTVARELEHVQNAQFDESGRISALAADMAALRARVELTEERAARAERALESVHLALSQLS